MVPPHPRHAPGLPRSFPLDIDNRFSKRLVAVQKGIRKARPIRIGGQAGGWCTEKEYLDGEWLEREEEVTLQRLREIFKYTVSHPFHLHFPRSRFAGRRSLCLPREGFAKRKHAATR